MCGHAVIGAYVDRAIFSELIGLEAVLNLRTILSFEMIFQAPRDLVGADKESAWLDAKTHPGLKQVPAVLAAGFESPLFRCSHRIKHAELSSGNRLPVSYPRLLVASIPQIRILSRPI